MLQNSSKKTALAKRFSLVIGLPLWVFISFELASLITYGIFQGVYIVAPDLQQANEIVLRTAAGAFVYVLAIAIVIGLPWLILRRKTTVAEVGLDKPLTSKDAFWLAPVGAVIYFVLSGLVAFMVATFLPFIDYSENQQTGFENIFYQRDYVLAFISLVILAPVAEEVLFRGYLFGKLRKHSPVWLASLITSLLFALVHAPWSVSIDVFVLSLVMCAATVKSGSLWSAIMIHMIKNAVAFYFLFINPIPF